jgi:hypothetical protein
MSSESRYAEFRAAATPAPAPAGSIPLDTLLAEVTRRQRLLHQMSAVLSADTAVIRNPWLRPPGVRVTATEWALLIRVRDRVTPRQLAWQLRRSVLGTTADIYRLMVLGLLAPAGEAADRTGGSWPGRALATAQARRTLARPGRGGLQAAPGGAAATRGEAGVAERTETGSVSRGPR